MGSGNTIIIIIQILFIAFVCPGVFSAPIIENNKHYYSVQGQTAAQIRSSLNNRSPVVVENRKFDAYTRWHVSWQFQYINSNGNCTISKVATRVEINHILPEIIDDLPPALYNKWTKYFHALLDHENGHADMAIEAASEIENSITSLPPFPQCTTLEKEANELGQKVIKKYIALEKRYDHETRYGAERGAVFP